MNMKDCEVSMRVKHALVEDIVHTVIACNRTNETIQLGIEIEDGKISPTYNNRWYDVEDVELYDDVLFGLKATSYNNYLYGPKVDTVNKEVTFSPKRGLAAWLPEKEHDVPWDLNRSIAQYIRVSDEQARVAILAMNQNTTDTKSEQECYCRSIFSGHDNDCAYMRGKK